MSTRSNSFFFGPRSACFFADFSRFFPKFCRIFHRKNLLFFCIFPLLFIPFPSPLPAFAQRVAVVACARFYDFIHCTFCRVRERLRASVCGKQVFSFAVFRRRFCGSSAISWRLWSRQNRFFEDFLHFAKREPLLKPRKVCFPALSHPESLIAEVLLSKRINKWVLNLQSVCCLYKSPATCFSALSRPERLCKGLFSLFIAR